MYTDRSGLMNDNSVCGGLPPQYQLECIRERMPQGDPISSFYGWELQAFIGTGISKVQCADECGRLRKMSFVKVCLGFALGGSVAAGPVMGLDGIACRPESYEGIFGEFGAAYGPAGISLDVSPTGVWEVGPSFGFLGQVGGCFYMWLGNE